MTNEDAEKFKSLLLGEKANLESRIAELADTDFGSDIDSDEEESDETEEIATNVSLEATFKERLNDINGALEKIEAGTYGTCEKCGREIDNELLSANPESRLCRECKANG